MIWTTVLENQLEFRGYLGQELPSVLGALVIDTFPAILIYFSLIVY